MIKSLNVGISGLLLNNLLMGLAVGLFLPLIPLRLDAMGFSALLVGLNAAASSLAVLLVAPLITVLLKKFGYLQVLTASCLIAAFAVLIMVFNPSYSNWTLMRFLFGIGVALHWICSESWLNQAVDDQHRGKILGIYVACFIGGMAGGALLLEYGGIEGYRPFIIILCLMLAATAVIPLTRNIVPDLASSPSLPLLWAVKRAPWLMTAALFMGLAQGSAMVLLAYYGAEAGLALNTAIRLQAVFLLGGVLGQIPIGWAVDRFNRLSVLVSLAAIAVIMTIMMHQSLSNPLLLYPILFVSGGVTFGVYTAALALLGKTFSLKGMAAANAAFVLIWESGTLSGGPLAGFAIELFGAVGFPAVVTSAMGVVVVIALLMKKQ